VRQRAAVHPHAMAFSEELRGADARRNLGNGRVDVAVDRVQALTDAGDGRDRNQRDESGEQRVLDQILALLFPNEALEQCFHLELSPQGELPVFAPNLALSSKRISKISRRTAPTGLGHVQSGCQLDYNFRLSSNWL